MYIHERGNWTAFRWDTSQVILLQEKVFRKQGLLYGRLSSLGFDNKLRAMAETELLAWPRSAPALLAWPLSALALLAWPHSAPALLARPLSALTLLAWPRSALVLPA